MKFVFRICAVMSGLLSLASGVTAPADWTNQLLTNVGATSNEVYFWPGASNEPNILTTGSTGTWSLQTGGPPTWTASAVNPDLSFRSGSFFPNGSSGSVLVNLSSGSIVAVVIGNTGPAITLVQSGVTTLHAVSCMTDTSGNIHLAYGFATGGVECIGYAQKPPNGGWTASAIGLAGYTVSGTAIQASSLTSVTVYFNVGPASSVGVMKTVNLLGNTLDVHSMANTTEGGVYGPIAAIRNSGTHFYYTRLNNVAGQLDLRDLDPSAFTASTVATVPASATKGICAAPGPDGKGRIVVFDTAGVIYYIKAGDGSVGKVATVTGALANADVRGIQFDANGVPNVLYRKSLTQSYVAYPTESVDADGNGRVDLMDIALRSSTGTMTALSPADAVTGVTNSAGHVKLQFPVVGSPTLVAGTATLRNATANLNYIVQTSGDLVTWAPVVTGMKYTLTGTGTTKTAVGVFTEAFPNPAKNHQYYRLSVTRVTNNF